VKGAVFWWCRGPTPSPPDLSNRLIPGVAPLFGEPWALWS